MLTEAWFITVKKIESQHVDLTGWYDFNKTILQHEETLWYNATVWKPRIPVLTMGLSTFSFKDTKKNVIAPIRG